MKPQQQYTQVSVMPNTVLMTSPGMVPQQTAPLYVTAQRPVNPCTAETYNSRLSIVLGITLIIIGLLATVCNIVGLAVNSFFGIVAHGFWCGSIFIVTGSFGIAAVSKNRTMIKAFMVLAIISALLTCSLFAIGLSGALINGSCNESYWGWDILVYCPNNQALAIACEASLAALAVMASVVSICGVINCCKAVGCCAPSSPSAGVFVMPYGNQQVFVGQSAGTNHHLNQQMTFSVSSPGNQLQGVSNGYPGPYPPTQHQYFAGQYPPQYSVASDTSLPAVTPAVTSPPGYAA